MYFLVEFLLLLYFLSMCVDVMVMSSAYVVSFAGACGADMSDE